MTGGNRGPLGRAAQLNPGRAENLTPIRGYHPSAYHLFTRSFEGRRFNNGIYLRPAERIHNTVFINYFAGGRSFYPYYSPTFSFGSAYYSPYYYYGGVCPPYIYSRFCLFLPPAVVYVETPVYVNNECLGYPSGGYYLQQYRDEVLARRDPGFERAVNDIREAFLERNIQPLVDITDPNIDIAVFAKGHYQYSMKSDDYLDITRDAFQNMTTISLNLDRVSRRAIGVYVVSGKQVYEDQNNQVHKVYVSFVLEHLNGQWVLTQVASSPG